MKYTIKIRPDSGSIPKLYLVKTVKENLGLGLKASKDLVDILFNDGVQETEDEVYVETLELVLGNKISIEIEDKYRDPLTDVFLNGEWVSKQRYDSLCEKSQRFYDNLSAVDKQNVDVYAKMHQIGPACG